MLDADIYRYTFGCTRRKKKETHTHTHKVPFLTQMYQTAEPRCAELRLVAACLRQVTEGARLPVFGPVGLCANMCFVCVVFVFTFFSDYLGLVTYCYEQRDNNNPGSLALTT